jgi:hypothetical protein
MCIFSSDVKWVEGTSIFVRRTSRTSQALVYSMMYEARSELAMILPLPKSAGAGEEAATFIDLSSYPHFFEDMLLGFPVKPKPRPAGLEDCRALSAAPLKVHAVGSFEASWVPTLSDFSRLDDRFKLPSKIWDQLPEYSDYGFAVFKLKAGAKTVHPMALEFQTREPNQLFFPTMHVHQRAVMFQAVFHHTLYCQSERPGANWKASATLQGTPLVAGDFLRADKAKGLLLLDQVVFKRPINGLRRNQDIWVAG